MEWLRFLNKQDSINFLLGSNFLPFISFVTLCIFISKEMGPLVRFESLELQEQVQEEDEQNITEGTAVDIDDPRYRGSFCLV